MGRLVYGYPDNSFSIDDRTLAHLRVVFMNKLRRSESFLFRVPPSDGSGQREIWVHPGISIVFHFYGSRPPALNRRWVDRLMHEANGPHGLTVTPEPDPHGEER